MNSDANGQAKILQLKQIWDRRLILLLKILQFAAFCDHGCHGTTVFIIFSKS